MQARNNLGTLGEEELLQFQAIIDMENPDLFKWLTGQQALPADVRAVALTPGRETPDVDASR